MQEQPHEHHGYDHDNQQLSVTHLHPEPHDPWPNTPHPDLFASVYLDIIEDPA